MGISSKKTSSTTNQTTSGTTNSTTTPTNPDWVTNGLAGVGETLSNLQSADPYSFVAGPDALQTQAATTASGLSSSPNFQTASNILTGVAGQGPNTYTATGYTPVTGTASSGLDNLGSWFNPFVGSVVDSSLQGFDQNAALTKAQNKLGYANDATFGGSGSAITDALTNGQLALSRGQLQSGLLSDAFNTAAQYSSADADRAQQMSLANLAAQNAAGQFNAGAQNTAGQYNAGAADTAANRQLAAGQGLADIGTAQGADQRANIGTQSDIGSILQQLTQQQTSAPLSTTGALASILSGLPLNLLHGDSSSGTYSGTGTSNGTTTTSDPLGSLGSLLAGGGSLASGLGALGLKISDARLKRDVVKLADRADGLGVYSYRYLWSDEPQIGVMAQEVLKVKPHAVVTLPSGYMAVDYGAL